MMKPQRCSIWTIKARATNLYQDNIGGSVVKILRPKILWIMAEQQRPKAKAIEVPTFHGIPGKDQLPPVAWVAFMENVQKSSG